MSKDYEIYRQARLDAEASLKEQMEETALRNFTDGYKSCLFGVMRNLQLFDFPESESSAEFRRGFIHARIAVSGVDLVFGPTKAYWKIKFEREQEKGNE